MQDQEVSSEAVPLLPGGQDGAAEAQDTQLLHSKQGGQRSKLLTVCPFILGAQWRRLTAFAHPS
jgi:hypothetical protein